MWATRGMMSNCYPEECNDIWQSRQGGQAGPVIADGRSIHGFTSCREEVRQGIVCRNKGKDRAWKNERKILSLYKKNGADEMVRKRLSVLADEVLLC